MAALPFREQGDGFITDFRPRPIGALQGITWFLSYILQTPYGICVVTVLLLGGFHQSHAKRTEVRLLGMLDRRLDLLLSHDFTPFGD